MNITSNILANLHQPLCEIDKVNMNPQDEEIRKRSSDTGTGALPELEAKKARVKHNGGVSYDSHAARTNLYASEKQKADEDLKKSKKWKAIVELNPQGVEGTLPNTYLMIKGDTYFNYLSNLGSVREKGYQQHYKILRLIFLFQQCTLIPVITKKEMHEPRSAIEVIGKVSQRNSGYTNYSNRFESRSPTLVPSVGAFNTHLDNSIIVELLRKAVISDQGFRFPDFSFFNKGPPQAQKNFNESFTVDKLRLTLLRPCVDLLKSLTGLRTMSEGSGQTFYFSPPNESCCSESKQNKSQNKEETQFHVTPDSMLCVESEDGSQHVVAAIEIKQASIDIKRKFLKFKENFNFSSKMLEKRGLSVEALEFMAVFNQVAHQMLFCGTNIGIISNYNCLIAFKINFNKIIESGQTFVDITGRISTQFPIQEIYLIEADNPDQSYACLFCKLMLHLFRMSSIEEELDLAETCISPETQKAVAKFLLQENKDRLDEAMTTRNRFVEKLVDHYFLNLQNSGELLDSEFYGLHTLISTFQQNSQFKLANRNGTMIEFEKIATSKFGTRVPKIIAGSAPQERWSLIISFQQVYKIFDPNRLPQYITLMHNKSSGSVGLAIAFFNYEMACYQRLMKYRVDCVPNVLGYGHIMDDWAPDNNSGSIRKRHKLLDLREAEDMPLSKLPVSGFFIKLTKVKKVAKLTAKDWVMRSAAVGLCKIHSAGIAHRDIKKDNILLGSMANGPSRAKKVIYVDFGFSKVYRQRGQGSRVEISNDLIKHNRKDNENDFLKDYEQLDNVFDHSLLDYFSRKGISIRSLIENEIANNEYWKVLESKLG